MSRNHQVRGSSPRIGSSCCEHTANATHSNRERRTQRAIRIGRRMDARKIIDCPLRVFTKQTDATRCSGGGSEKFRVNMPDKALNQVREGDNKSGAGAVDP